MTTYTLELTVDGKTQLMPLDGMPGSVVLRLYRQDAPVQVLVAERVVL